MIVTSTKDGVVVDRPQEQIRQPVARPWWRSSYAGFLGALAILYVAGYGSFLLASDGLPYVLDNNESFSVLLHATNLYEFGLSKSWGLTDEATGPHPASHPYVHTHQGNFPRIFGWLIYVLGARTIESQILVTTFTVGTVTLFLAYHVFARLAGPMLAFVACVAFLSDYIHVAQWYVNTYRIWHFFFIFSSLVCAYGLASSRRRLWLGLTFVNALALFYCELVSVAFTSMLAGLFVISLYWRQPRLVVAWTATHAAGGMTALLILVIQLVGYLGWENFLIDVWLTFNARNFGAEEDFRMMVNEFYQKNNILFWQNFVDGSKLRSLSAFVDAHARFIFQVYTPILSLIVLVLTTGWLLGLSWGYESIWRICRQGPTGTRRVIVQFQEPPVYADGALELGIRDLSPTSWRRLAIANTIGRFALLFLPISLVLFMVIQGEGVAGLVAPSAPIATLASSAVIALIAGAGASVLLMRVITGAWWAPSRLPLGRLCVVAIFLLGVSLFIGQQPRLYVQAYRAIWYDPIVSIIPLWVERIALLLALGLAVSMTLFGTARVLGASWTSRLGGLAVYLTCAGIAYMIAYGLATGYVSSGYIVRSAPLPVFVTGVLVAFAACIVMAAVARACTAGANSTSGSRLVAAWGRPALGATAALLLVWMAGYWIVLNRSYITLFPPDQFAFLKQFAGPPLHGKSAVVNNYGIPLGVMSGNWTYYDHNFGGESDVRLTPAGYVPVDDPRQFLWLADKQQNPDYLRPETFVCVRMPNFDTVAKRLNGGRELELADCGALPLIRRIERKTQRIVEHKLVARDKNTPSTWAIVTLDWDFPPYLLNLDDGRSDEVVRLVVNQQPDTLTVQVQYRYAHQDGLPEKGSTVRLNAAGADGRWCVFERSSSRNSFTLPADFRGTLRPSVMPRTETKAGPETFGKPVVIGDGQGTPCTGK